MVEQYFFLRVYRRVYELKNETLDYSRNLMAAVVCYKITINRLKIEKRLLENDCGAGGVSFDYNN